MELTLESAFSPGGLVGNMSYILLIASMMMRRMFWLRLLAIASGLFGIGYDVIWLRDPVGTFWETTFTVTNLVQWLLLVREDRRLRLSHSEQGLWRDFFPGLTSRECKTLLLASRLVDIPAGTRILEKGEPVEKMFVLLSGNVDIVVNGATVSACSSGDLIGEMSFLTGDTASADTVVRDDAKLLEVEQDNLAALIKASPALGHSINNLISRNLVAKLERQTRIGVALTKEQISKASV